MNRGETVRVLYPPAVKAGVVLVALMALWGSFAYLRFESNYQQQYRDPYEVAAQVSRFETFGTAVSENAILGYLTDLAPGSITADAMFGAAQYVLAPRLLQKSTEYDLVLGNFTKPGDFASLGRAHGLRLERDFGNGVVLFRREVR